MSDRDRDEGLVLPIKDAVYNPRPVLSFITPVLALCLPNSELLAGT